MINVVVINGRLTKDVEIRYTQDGKPVANFTIAVNRLSNGEQQADFIDCVAWSKNAENLAKYTKKGSNISVKGSLRTRTYEKQDGSKQKVVEVLSELIQFLDSKQQSNEQSNNYQNQSNNNYQQQQSNWSQQNQTDPFGQSSGKIDITEEDLPF